MARSYRTGEKRQEIRIFHISHCKEASILALIMELLGEQVLPHMFWYCQANAAAAYESCTPSTQPAEAVSPVMMHRTQAPHHNLPPSKARLPDGKI